MTGNTDKAGNHLIISEPTIMMGKPVIAGTRITVELILDKFAVGASVDQILQSYPHLNRQMILAALEFAKEASNKEKVYAID